MALPDRTPVTRPDELTVAEAAFEVVRVDVGDQPELRVVGRSHRLRLVGEGRDRRDGAEDLLP